MLKQSTYLLLALLCSCSPDITELREDTLILTTILEAGSTEQTLQLFSLSGAGSQPNFIRQGEIRLTHPNGETFSYQQADNNYQLAIEPSTIEPQKAYLINAKVDNKNLRAQCTMPPPINILSVSSTSITVNPASIGSTAFILSWQALDPSKYAYLLTLENLEESPVEIPFSVPSGNFKNQFNGPWENAGAILFDTDFKYYGHHRLKIMAIDRATAAVYFYGPADIRGLLQNGPDNIDGGRGYCTGITSKTIDLWIQ